MKRLYFVPFNAGVTEVKESFIPNHEKRENQLISVICYLEKPPLGLFFSKRLDLIETRVKHLEGKP